MQLHFEKSGQGEPLVMMHGLFGSLENLGTVSRLLEEHFTLYRLDLRNHGRSPHSDSMSFDEMAADLVEFMDGQGLSKAHVFGHSLGGKVAMAAACKVPQRINGLIVADIAPTAYPPHHNAILEGLRSIDVDNISSRREADEQLAVYVEELGVRQFLLRSLERDGDGHFRWRLNVPVILKDYDNMSQAVGEGCVFSGPTLFIRGGRSNYITDRHHSELYQKFPKAEIVTVDEAGHWVHAENPKAVADAIINFLHN